MTLSCGLAKNGNPLKGSKLKSVLRDYTCEDSAGGGIISRPGFEGAANTFSMSAGYIAVRKAFSTRGCANGIATLPEATRSLLPQRGTLRASQRTPAKKQASKSVW
ncbi:hypothetical protein [Nostoc sp.]|uniref:hypothetical protein n=1 Tax=Nostoc sp. TaxID=1180 RepID=UPI002FFA27E7